MASAVAAPPNAPSLREMVRKTVHAPPSPHGAGVAVAVFVGVSVAVLVAVLVGVSVAVLVAVFVGVVVGVLVAAGIGVFVRQISFMQSSPASQQRRPHAVCAARHAHRRRPRVSSGPHVPEQH
jgi:hypothetical protein